MRKILFIQVRFGKNVYWLQMWDGGILQQGEANHTSHFDILISPHDTSLAYQSFDFSKEQPTDSDITSYLTFIERTGLKNSSLAAK